MSPGRWKRRAEIGCSFYFMNDAFTSMDSDASPIRKSMCPDLPMHMLYNGEEHAKMFLELDYSSVVCGGKVELFG